MELSINQKRKLRQTGTLMIVGTLLGPIYVIFSDGFNAVAPFINATVIAFLIFQVKFTIRSNREKYLNDYGFLPTFSAGFHSGKVIVGEIGDVKSQISFFGDVLYDTALIEKQCKKYEKDNLVSEDLMKRLSLPEIYEMKLVGKLEKHDKDLDLYTISEIDIASA